MGSQKDIDDLFAQMSGDAPAAAPAAEKSTADEAAAENKAAAGLDAIPTSDTGTTVEATAVAGSSVVENVQVENKVKPSSNAAPVANSAAPTKGVWGSEPEPRFVKVSEALDDRMFQLQKRMRVNEDLMMSFLFHDNINEAYYRLWRVDANDYFRCLCTVKHRIKRAREQEAQISSAQKSSSD